MLISMSPKRTPTMTPMLPTSLMTMTPIRMIRRWVSRCTLVYRRIPRLTHDLEGVFFFPWK
jgi:hypothetical protein